STMGFFRYGVDHYVPGDPAAGSPSSSTGNYKMMQADGNGVENHSYTTWHDNGIYNVGSGSYNKQKPLMLQQLKYIADYDLIFSDYFHAATISYMGNTVFGSFGWQMIDEDSDIQTHIPSDKRNAAAFGEYFLNDLQKNAMNFMADHSGNHMDGLYRTCYSQTALDNMPIEQAAANAAGVVFGMTPEQMTKFGDLAGTLMDRIDTTGLYLRYLKAETDFTKYYAIYKPKGDSPFKPIINIMLPVTDELMPDSYYTALFGKTAGQFIEEVWKELNAPTEEELQNQAVADKYKEDRAKGYLFLQDILDDEQISKLSESIPVVGFMLLQYLKMDYDATGNDVLGTMVYNASRMISNHVPEIDLAWLRTYDSYYDNQNCKMQMAKSVLVNELAAPVADKAEGNDVVLSSNDPTLTLFVPGDVNQGAGIFYTLDGGALHPYCGPIKLDPVEGDPVTHVVNTFAIHDGIRSAANTINVTVTPGYELAVTYPAPIGQPILQRIPIKRGETYTFQAPVLETRVFKHWFADPDIDQYISGFDQYSRENTVTILQDGNYEFEAFYYFKNSAVELVLNGITEDSLPDTAVVDSVLSLDGYVWEDKEATVNASWTKNEDGSYTVTIYLPNDPANELAYIGQLKEDRFGAYDDVLLAGLTINTENGVSVECVGDPVGIVNKDGSAQV
ncbi:MAG: hypothetical protein KBS83_00670, partial [Lachnospiraceae bacterium]|nr:hypothetical protein [Candidatus Equihabitans merdae]